MVRWVRLGSATRAGVPPRSGRSRTLRAAEGVARRRAILDRRCARRHSLCAGRGGRMVPIEQKDGRTSIVRADRKVWDRKKKGLCRVLALDIQVPIQAHLFITSFETDTFSQLVSFFGSARTTTIRGTCVATRRSS